MEFSCRVCRAAWKRGRSLSIGEFMKRGLGLRKEFILWNSVGRLGVKSRVISLGEGIVFFLDYKVSIVYERGFF